MSDTDFRFYVATDDEQPDMSGKRRDVIVAGPYLTAMQAEEARHWYIDRHPKSPAPYRVVVR